MVATQECVVATQECVVAPQECVVATLGQGRRSAQAGSGRHWGRNSKITVFDSKVTPNYIIFHRKVSKLDPEIFLSHLDTGGFGVGVGIGTETAGPRVRRR